MEMRGSLASRVGDDGEAVDGDEASLRLAAIAKVDEIDRRLAWVEGQLAVNDARVSRFEAAAERILQRLPLRAR